MNLTIKPLKYSVNTDGIEKYITLLEKKLQIVVDKATLDVKYLSQNYVPIDQGVAKASHYAVTSKGSGREEAIAEAQAKALSEPSKWGNQGRTVQFDSEEAELKALHGFICVAVIYGLELEFGFTSGSLNVAAGNPNAQRPFLTVAMAEYEPIFIKACTKVMQGMK